MKNISSETREKTFGETRHENYVKFTVDGQETFKLIYENILKASKSIYLINYDLDPNLQFVRYLSSYYSQTQLITNKDNSTFVSTVEEQEEKKLVSPGIGGISNLKNIFTKKEKKESLSRNISEEKIDDGNKNTNTNTTANSTTTEITTTTTSSSSSTTIIENISAGLLISKSSDPNNFERNQEFLASCLDNKNTPLKIKYKKYMSYPLIKLLLAKALEGVNIKIIVWQPKLPVRMMPNAGKKGIDGRADEIETINTVAKAYGVEKNLIAKIDTTTPSLISGHHEKMIMIDKIVGFCGGLDLSKGKWDTSLHEYDNPIRDKDAEPFHDVHCMVKGEIINDLLYHFDQRWKYAQTGKPDPSANNPNIKNIRFRVSNYKLDRLSDNDIVYNTEVTALRTWKDMDNDGGILKWYYRMFEKATESIYIENQFPFQDDEITNTLIERLSLIKNLKVIIVGPMDPNLPGLIGSMISRMSVNDINKNLKKLIEAGEGGKRVKVFSLISQDKNKPELRRQIYVHSKVMIVDDKWVTIGSANMDKNGFRDSSEFNLGIKSGRLAKNLRTRLWEEHLGKIKGKVNRTEALEMTKRYSTSQTNTENYDQYDYEQLKKFDTGFMLWDKIAHDNGIKLLNNNLITGHVYHYNFKELNLPPPFPDAKGIDAFEIL